MFDIFGIIFLIIILIFLIVGFASGFVSLILGFAKGLIAIIIAALLCNPIGMALSNSSMGKGLSNKIEASIVEVNPLFNEVITNENKQVFIEESLGKKLSEIKIPETISKHISNLIVKNVHVPEEGITCAKFIASGISMFVLIISSFVVVSLIVFIILSIIQKISKHINAVPLVGIVNRLAGAAISVVISLVIIAIICYVLSFIMTLQIDLADTIRNALKLGEEHKDEFTIGKFFYEHNVLKWIFNLIFK